MAAGKLDLWIEQGADYALEVAAQESPGVPLDLTGASIVAQIRKTATSSEVAAQFEVENDEPTTGVFFLRLTAEQTKSIQDDYFGGTGKLQTRYVWDLMVRTAEGVVYRLLEGQATLSPAVSEFLEVTP